MIRRGHSYYLEVRKDVGRVDDTQVPKVGYMASIAEEVSYEQDSVVEVPVVAEPPQAEASEPDRGLPVPGELREEDYAIKDSMEAIEELTATTVDEANLECLNCGYPADFLCGGQICGGDQPYCYSCSARCGCLLYTSPSPRDRG